MFSYFLINVFKKVVQKFLPEVYFKKFIFVQ
jgi:hypothetical protein